MYVTGPWAFVNQEARSNVTLVRDDLFATQLPPDAFDAVGASVPAAAGTICHILGGALSDDDRDRCSQGACRSRGVGTESSGDLVVGIIIGAAFGRIVSSLVNDLLTPSIGLLLDTGRFLQLIHQSLTTPHASLAEAKAAGTPTLNYRVLLSTVIDFLIVALAIFLVVRLINRLY
jgi:large conductance mechanosensitive channel protein